MSERIVTLAGTGLQFLVLKSDGRKAKVRDLRDKAVYILNESRFS